MGVKKKHIILLLISTVILSIGPNLNTANVKASHVQQSSAIIMPWQIKRHHHSRRYYRIEHRKAVKRHREHLIKRHHLHEKYLQHQNQILSQAADQGDDFKDTIRNELLHDINLERRHYGVNTLRPSAMMQKASDYRITHVKRAYANPNGYLNYPGQNSDNWVHGMDTHTSVYDYLAKHYHRHHYFGGENVCDFEVGPFQQSDYTWPPYNNDTPSGVADNIDNDFMFHDVADGNHNGHRDNELNPHYKYFGVSVNYDSAANYGEITEDFFG